ncbi:hypothetical protein [Maritimibacter dapengensis]|uniref:Uncharacterized protein n=1 Tax=Maritimibacter dapengensis TaxID=2836868 RepID=A0ABS6SX26_9RHOB|nr:hypothetical protein [Maritimibacter dapengensis]MBV7377459.1 hypothetical protein [Maritimibacter dapengensis]
MPIWLLGAFVVVGLIAIWVAMRFYGYDKPLTLDEDAARREFMADNPGLEPDDIRMAKTGQAALVRANGNLHVLWVMGQDVATHVLDAPQIIPTNSGLVLTLRDFAAPRVKLELAPDEASTWTALIEKT